MRRIGILVPCAVVLTGSAVLSVSTPARAECSLFPVPPATDAARSAREVVVGTVIENVGGQLYDFRLRIDHVLRGPAQVGDVRRLEFFGYGWPLALREDGTTVSPCQALPGWKGNVIALAVDAFAPDGKARYNAASWFAGAPLHRDDVPRTTLAEMRSSTELPTTDAGLTEPAALPPSSDSGPPVIALAGLAAAAVAVLSIRRGTYRPRGDIER